MRIGNTAKIKRCLGEKKEVTRKDNVRGSHTASTHVGSILDRDSILYGTTARIDRQDEANRETALAAD